MTQEIFFFSNKAKETHFKILHKIYPVNFNVCKYLYIDRSCSFCKQAEETLIHLFLGPRFKQFWSDLGSHIFDSDNVVHSFSLKYIIFDYDNTKNKPLELTIILFLFKGFCLIYKQRYLKKIHEFRCFPYVPLFVYLCNFIHI